MAKTNNVPHSSVQYYRQFSADLERLTAEEEATLIGKIQAGDNSALDELIMHHIPLAESIALDTIGNIQQYHHMDDFIQSAVLSLAKAARDFDPSKGVRFSTFATPIIQRAMYQEVKALEPVKFSQDFYFNVLTKVRQYQSAYAAAHDSAQPSKEEVCKALKITPQQYRDAMINKNIVSMEELVNPENEKTSIADTLADDSADFAEELAIKDAVKDALSCLPPRSREIIAMRFGLNEYHETSSAEIGELFSLSKRQVNNIISDSLKAMQRHLSRGEREER